MLGFHISPHALNGTQFICETLLLYQIGCILPEFDIREECQKKLEARMVFCQTPLRPSIYRGVQGPLKMPYMVFSREFLFFTNKTTDG